MCERTRVGVGEDYSESSLCSLLPPASITALHVVYINANTQVSSKAVSEKFETSYRGSEF